MSSLRKNIGGQKIGFCLNAIATGNPVTAGGAGNVSIDGGAQAACAGTFTHLGTGQWIYAPTQAETNGTNISFAFTGTGAIQVGMTFFTIGYDPTVANLPVNVIQVNGTNQTARDIGASVIAASVTAGVTVTTNNDKTGYSITTNNDKTGYTLTGPANTAVADAMFDEANGIEAGLTLRQFCRMIGATAGGKLSGAGTGTEIFRNAVADSAVRVTATCDINGNRTAIAYNL